MRSLRSLRCLQLLTAALAIAVISAGPDDDPRLPGAHSLDKYTVRAGDFTYTLGRVMTGCDFSLPPEDQRVVEATILVKYHGDDLANAPVGVHTYDGSFKISGQDLPGCCGMIMTNEVCNSVAEDRHTGDYDLVMVLRARGAIPRGDTINIDFKDGADHRIQWKAIPMR